MSSAPLSSMLSVIVMSVRVFSICCLSYASAFAALMIFYVSRDRCRLSCREDLVDD